MVTGEVLVCWIVDWLVVERYCVMLLGWTVVMCDVVVVWWSLGECISRHYEIALKMVS